MNRTSILLRTLPIVSAAALFGTWFVHSRAGNETFACDAGRCQLGSGASWLLTGVTLIAPFVALLGFLWSRWLHDRDRLGPFSHRAIPDGEQILETLGVAAAGLLTYWIATRGPTIEAVDVDFPNSSLAGRVSDEGGANELVPTRRSWFAIGAVLSSPFAFSLGSMIGREFYGRRRRRHQADDADHHVIDLRSDDVIDLRFGEDVDIEAEDR